MCIRDSSWRQSLASGDAQSLPLFQQLARGDPPRGDDVYPLSAVAATGRGYSVRAGYRHLPRVGSVLVEPVRSDVCGRDQGATPSSSVVFAMALAPGRGVRQDQWSDALSVACGRSRRRGARGLRDKAAGSKGCAEISEAHDEALRPTAINCNRPATVAPSCDESNRQCCRSGVRSVAQQSGREFPPAVPTTRTSDGEVQGHENPTE